MSAAKKPHRETQVEYFKRVARELGCDESEEAFDEALRKVAKRQPPKKDKGDKPDD